ncbi:MAG: nodulation protein NfeD [Chitinophagales bacterium]|nr:nodulation protein NfeD [Chitinophagales bacterium]
MQYIKSAILFLFITIAISGYAKSVPNIYQLQLKQEIDKGAVRLINRAIKDAEQQKADVFLLELDTYGGLLDAADEIRTTLLNTKLKTVVWINNNAASAGALISISCDSIYMSDGANIGAATVVDQNGEKVADKYQSYMRGLMRSTAETNGRDPKIAEAMVDEDLSVEGINDTGKILTFTTTEAIQFGYCEGKANDIQTVKDFLGMPDAKVTVHKVTTLDKLINFLLSPFINSILIMMIIGGIWFELKAPGIGFPLAIAILGAVLYFAPLYLEGLAANWEIAIFVIGLILIALEIFVIPGFGIAGVLGIIFVIGGLTLSLFGNLNFDIPGNAMSVISKALFRVSLTLVFGFILLTWLGGNIFNFPLFNKMVLQSEQKATEGYTINQTHSENLIGSIGTAYTDLRPAGKVVIGEDIYDAITEAEFILKEAPIKVIGISGYSLKVRKVS